MQFTRAPIPGQVKTRLIPVCSAAEACAIHRELTLWTCRTLIDSKLGSVILSVAGEASSELFQQCRDMGVESIWSQGEGDLGKRMHAALSAALRQFDHVVLVGSDCPQLDRHYLARALAALETVPCVIGPAADGGYVLLGMTQVAQELFQGIDWGTSAVLAQTRRALVQIGWTHIELDVLRDIDRPEDIELWESIKRERVH